jgi:hypothetical protein
MFYNFFSPRKYCRLRNNVEKFGENREAAGDNIAARSTLD